MKITQQTRSQLILRQQLLGAWLLSIFVSLLGIFLFIAYDSPVDWLGAFCIATGSLIKLFTPVEVCVFDKGAGRVVFKQQGWWKQRVTQYPIEQIIKVQVNRSVYVGTDFYSVALLTVSGSQLSLTKFPTTDVEKQEQLASSIRRFLI
jgi:hypothetical protein